MRNQRNRTGLSATSTNVTYKNSKNQNHSSVSNSNIGLRSKTGGPNKSELQKMQQVMTRSERGSFTPLREKGYPSPKHSARNTSV